MSRFLSMLMAFALAACSLAPDYQRPAAPVPEQWPNGQGGQAGQAAALRWQTFFPDPRLQGLIAAALEHNRDLRIAVARVEEARAQYGIARADRLPTVNLAASRNAARTPADLSATGQRVTTQRYDVDLAVAAFEIDFWGRVANLADAARSSYLATDEARRAFRLSLIADVANAYLTLLETRERQGIAADTDGNLYIVDALFETVQVFDPAGQLLYYFGSTGTGPGQFQLPSGVSIDDRNRIYVADSQNRRVQIFLYRRAGQ